MAESIEYSSIVKFINEDIIQGKLSALVGGSAEGAKEVNNEALKKELSSMPELASVIKNQGVIIDILADTLASQIVDAQFQKYRTQIGILCFGLAVAGYHWMNSTDSEERNQRITYILGTTIIAFVLSGPTTELLTYVKNLLMGKSDGYRKKAIGKELDTQEINKFKTSLQGYAEINGGGAKAISDAAKKVFDFVKENLPIILGVVGAVAVAGYFADVRLGESLSQNVTRILGLGKSSSSKNASFHFNASNGRIEVTGSANKDVPLNSSKHFGIDGIKMIVRGSDITYRVNETPLDSISYIEGKPVHTALVMAYMVKDRSSHMPSAVSSKADAGYKYAIEDDGSVRLFNESGAEIASINMAIRQQLEGKVEDAKKTREEVCRALFKVGESDATCSAHFYNILGKSALGMLENMGKVASKEGVADALVTAKPHIQYEILKNLDWKMKVSNGNKEMVSVDQWLERLGQDTRPEMKSLVAQYKEYFAGNSAVKSILDRMVANLNNNTRLLDEKYKEAVATPQPAIRRRRARLSAAQVANLRSQVLTDNVSLNAPFPVPGRPGVFLSNYSSPFGMNGGADNSLQAKFAAMKQSLAAFNQKLSSDTERKINSKIEEITELDTRLSDIHRKINEYTRILRTEKYPTNISRTVSLSDVENLVNQYKSGTQEQTKQIVTLSTAFGKIKMLLEKADVNSKPSAKNYLFDL